MMDTHDLVPLRNIVELIMGQAPPSKDTNYEQRGTPFVKVGEFGCLRPAIRQWTTNPLRIARKSDVLLCVVGATCGKINLGEDCAIGRSVAAIRPNPAKLDQLYLYYFMMTLVDRLRSGSVGAAQTVISKEMVESINIPLPTLFEQQRIVALLNEAFAGLATVQANAERNLQNAREVFGSHLAVTFSQREDGWAEMSLEAVVDPSCTLSYGIVQPGEDYLDGLPVVRPTDLRANLIHLDGLKRIDPKLAEGYRRTTLQGGELLLCVRGSTGVASIAAPELRGANVTRGIVPVRFNNAYVLPELGYYLMKSEHVQSQIREKTYGAALMQINIRDLRAITLFVPSLKEQSVMALTLSELDAEFQHLTQIYERKLAALEELKQSLLQQAFNGEL